MIQSLIELWQRETEALKDGDRESYELLHETFNAVYAELTSKEKTKFWQLLEHSNIKLLDIEKIRL
jgi:hypothetical protein